MVNKIFNIGLPKTGTSSLNEALNELGFKSKHFPQVLRKQAMEGRYRFDNDDWQALTNFGEHFYPQLDKEYPNSKFILTVRDEDKWLDSWKRQIGKSTVENVATDFSWFQSKKKWLREVKMAVCNSKNTDTDINVIETRIEVFGTYAFHASRCRYVYRLHHRNVLDYFKSRPDDLVIMDICAGDGWDILCPFLGITEIPEIPFPHNRPSASPAV